MVTPLKTLMGFSVHLNVQLKFYNLPYIYCLLNYPAFTNAYKDELKKDFPRIPAVKHKMEYVITGEKLMNLHLNYETVPPYNGVKVEFKDSPIYKVSKMQFGKHRNKVTNKLEKDLSTIVFNESIKINNIPAKAYRYVINGKSAIEWIMDQYQVKTDKKSGITDDPNDYSDDPKYIFNLLLRIINVSVQTVDLINQLPKFEVDESFYKDDGEE